MAHSASERSLAYGFIGVLSPSLSTSFSFICLYFTTFPASDFASPNLFPGLLVQPLVTARPYHCLNPTRTLYAGYKCDLDSEPCKPYPLAALSCGPLHQVFLGT